MFFFITKKTAKKKNVATNTDNTQYLSINYTIKIFSVLLKTELSLL